MVAVVCGRCLGVAHEKDTTKPLPPCVSVVWQLRLRNLTAPTRMSFSVSGSLSSLPPGTALRVSYRQHGAQSTVVWGLEKTLCSEVVYYPKSPPLSGLPGRSTGESLPCPPRRRCYP